MDNIGRYADQIIKVIDHLILGAAAAQLTASCCASNGIGNSHSRAYGTVISRARGETPFQLGWLEGNARRKARAQATSRREELAQCARRSAAAISSRVRQTWNRDAARALHCPRHLHKRSPHRRSIMGRGILLWMLGVPIPVIILLALIWH
ncbi:MAG: hypothetical protein ABSC95_23455 [Acetobacteraceae bacterium]|jgi:hypothetical protein